LEVLWYDGVVLVVVSHRRSSLSHRSRWNIFGANRDKAVAKTVRSVHSIILPLPTLKYNAWSSSIIIMSAAKTGLEASDEVCACCGIAAVDDIKLKLCDGGCDLVKYCGDECQ